MHVHDLRCLCFSDNFAGRKIRYAEHDQHVEYKFNAPDMDKVYVHLQDKSGGDVKGQPHEQGALGRQSGYALEEESGQHDRGHRNKEDPVQLL